MVTLRKLLVLSTVCCGNLPAADTSLLNLIMPDAQVLVGANVERIIKSEIGQQIGAQLQGKVPDLKQILQTTGFDPTRDIKEVMIAATAKGQNGPALVLVRGSFDAEKIRTGMAGSGRKTRTFLGVQILVNPAQTKSAFAFLDDTTVVGGDLDQVEAAIRRRSHAAVLDSKLASQVAAMRDRYDIWVVSAASLSQMTEGISSDQMRQAGELVKMIDQVAGGLKFSANLDLGLNLTAKSEKDAERLRDALQLLVGMAAASQKDSRSFDINALKLTSDEKTVHIAITVTGEQLKKASEMQMARLKNGMIGPAKTVVRDTGVTIQSSEHSKPAAQDGGITIQSSERDMGTVVISSK